MKQYSFLSIILFSSILSIAQTNKIKTYFSRPVNNEVSSGTNAIYLNHLIDDTLIAYINRAKYSIDMAIYSFNETDESTNSISSISTAINNAYSRGVKIRWIYDQGSANPSLSLLDTNIRKLASPKSTSTLWYGYMHNKFMVIDANSENQNDPIVWTGSTNWTTTQINIDANNVVIIQDKAVAQAYTTEFNEMWGGTELTPDLTNSKFGFTKTDNTQHIFNVDGTIVEVYFSPSDGVNSKIIKAISTANTDLYFGVYSFTVAEIADSIASKFQKGVYTAGIIDPTCKSYPPYVSLSPIMGTNLYIDNISGLYHNKMLIVDPASSALDPIVLTGSHNWSASADGKNDENTVIIHNATIANVYYQSFYQNFVDMGGTLEVQTSINEISNYAKINVFPNPCNEYLSIKSSEKFRDAQISIFNSIGKELNLSTTENNNLIVIDTKNVPEGLYFLKIKNNNSVEIKKFQKIK